MLHFVFTWTKINLLTFVYNYKDQVLRYLVFSCTSKQVATELETRGWKRVMNLGVEGEENGRMVGWLVGTGNQGQKKMHRSFF
jgi:hypothetical protein